MKVRQICRSKRFLNFLVRANSLVNRLFLLLWASSAGVLGAASKQPADGLRVDLRAKLGPVLCSQKEITPQIAWSMGVYDAEVSGKYFTARKLSDANISSLAVKHAASTGSFGHSYGKCKNGIFWMISVSSPYSLKNFLKNPDFCDRSTILFAENGVSQPFEVDLSKPLPKKKGMLGIYCLKGTTKKTFFLKPVQSPPTNSIPEKLDGEFQSLDKVGFIKWLNKVRAKLKLDVVANKDLLRSLTDPLQNTNVQHNLEGLARLSQQLKVQGFEFIGENRVLAADAQQLLWQLWYSPLHRKLLLDARVRYFHFDLKRTGNSYRLFLIGMK